MSTRQMRRYLESLGEAKPKELSPEPAQDFEPLYVTKVAGQFGCLDVSSLPNSDAEEAHSDDNHDVQGIDPDFGMAASLGASNVKSKAKKKRNKKKRNKKTCIDEVTGTSNVAVDEVERIVQEVNMILGEPEVPMSVPQAPTFTIKELLKVEHKYLDFNVEFDRLFGPEEGTTRRRHNENHSRRQIAVSRDTPHSFTARGIRMDLISNVDGVKYFKFVHSAEYQRNLFILLSNLKLYYYYEDVMRNPQVFASKTIEALLENLNLYFQIEETSLAIKALEQALHFMQSIVDQAFNYTDGKTRLEYVHVENRPFHVILLRYIYVLTNKACHRTALEIAKVMLSLDPSDPLGVILVVDVLALRAREHRWLVDLYEMWEEKGLSYLFHMRYSVALAMWHLAQASKIPEDMVKADEFIQTAIIKFPNMAAIIMQCANKRNERISSHQMFNELGGFSTPTPLLKLQQIYAKYIWMKWETASLEWLMAKCVDALTRFDNESTFKDKVIQEAKDRSRLFRKHPIQTKRHLHTILSMTTYLPDPDMKKDIMPTIAFNPYPNEGKCVDDHRYYAEWGAVYTDNEPEPSIFRTFFTSLIPETPREQ